MSEFVNINDVCKVFLDSLKISKNMNNVNFQAQRNMPEATTFPNSWRRFKPGLKDAPFSGTGQTDFAAGENNELLYARLSTEGHIFSVSLGGGNVSDPAAFYKASLEQFDVVKAQVGDLAMFDFSVKKYASVPVVRGYVAEDSETERTADFDGTILNLGSAPAGTQLYGALHVISAPAGVETLDITVQSDDNAGMLTPATVFSFTQITSPTLGQEIKNSSSNLQQYYRISVNVSSTGVWVFFVALGYAI